MIVTQLLSKSVSATATRETFVGVRYDTADASLDRPAELVDTTTGAVLYAAPFRTVLATAKIQLGLFVPMWRNL